MTPGDKLRAEWDELIENDSVVMTRVIVNFDDFHALMVDRNEDRSIDIQPPNGLFFRTLPVERRENHGEACIETRKA